jgi:integrase
MIHTTSLITEIWMASILKRGDFSYQVIIRRRGFPVQCKTFETKADAQKWARMVERDMDRGSWRDTGAAEVMTLGDVLRRYLAEVTPLKRGAEIEAVKINAILRDQICSLRMMAVSGMTIAGWRDRRLKIVKGSTVNRELAIIRHAIDIARKEWGLHIDNPCSIVRRPSSSMPRDRRLVGDEQRYLIDAMGSSRNPYIRPLVLLGLETAMRRGELLDLRWKHIKFDGLTAFLPMTKNGQVRTVPLSSAAVRILQAIPRSIDGRVFPITMESFKQAFVRSIDRARTQYLKDCANTKLTVDNAFLVDLRFHDLRHEAASRLFEKGLNVMEVASITGHKSLQMLKRYTHLRAEDLAKKLG